MRLNKHFFRSLVGTCCVGCGLVIHSETVWGQTMGSPRPTRIVKAESSSTPRELAATVDGVSVRTEEHGWVYFGRRDEQTARLHEGASDTQTKALWPIAPYGRVGNLVLSDDGEVRFQAYIDFVPWSEQLDREVVAFGLVGEATAVGESVAYYGDAQGLRIRETLRGTEMARLVPEGPMLAADVSWDQSVAVTISTDSITLWDLETRAVARQFSFDFSEGDAPKGVKILRGSEQILMLFPGSGIGAFDLLTGIRRPALVNDSPPVDLELSWNRDIALVRRSDSSLEVWNLADETQAFVIPFETELLDSALEINFDGPPEALWALTRDGVLQRHSLFDGGLLERINATETFFWPESLEFSPGGRLAMVFDVFADQGLILDIESGRRYLIEFEFVDFLDDRQFLLRNSEELGLYEIRNSVIESVWVREFSDPYDAEVVRGQIEVILSREDHSVRQELDVATGATVSEGRLPPRVAFNGEYEAPIPHVEGLGVRYRVVSEDVQGSVAEEVLIAELWDSSSESPLKIFENDLVRRKELRSFFNGAFEEFVGQDFVEAMSWNQRYLAFGVGARCLVWDLENGNLILNLEEPGGELSILVFDETSQSLAVSFRDGGANEWLRVWRLSEDGQTEILDLDFSGRISVRFPGERIEVDIFEEVRFAGQNGSQAASAEDLGLTTVRTEVFDGSNGGFLEDLESFRRLRNSRLRLTEQSGVWGDTLFVGMRTVAEETRDGSFWRTFKPEIRGSGYSAWLRDMEGELVGHFRDLPSSPGLVPADRGRGVIDRDSLVCYLGIGSSVGAWDLESGRQTLRLELAIDDLPHVDPQHLFWAEPIQVSEDKQKLLVGFTQYGEESQVGFGSDHPPTFYGVIDLLTSEINWMPELIDRSTVLVQPTLERMVYSASGNPSALSVWNFVTESLETELPVLNRSTIGSTAALILEGARLKLADSTLSKDGSTLATVDNDGIRIWNLNDLSSVLAGHPPLKIRRTDDGSLELFWVTEMVADGAVIQARSSLDLEGWKDISVVEPGVYSIDPLGSGSSFYRWKP